MQVLSIYTVHGYIKSHTEMRTLPQIILFLNIEHLQMFHRSCTKLKDFDFKIVPILPFIIVNHHNYLH